MCMCIRISLYVCTYGYACMYVYTDIPVCIIYGYPCMYGYTDIPVCIYEYPCMYMTVFVNVQ